MPSKKSKYAFQFSLETLSEGIPVRKGKEEPEFYMWTFTFVEALDIDIAAMKWHRFLNGKGHTFRECFPYVQGLRVFEQHPGREMFGEKWSHGLHIHALMDTKVPIEIVSSLWRRRGGGHIHVCRIPLSEAMYVAKYLTKTRSEGLGNRRLWAAFGFEGASKVKDICVNTSWAETYHWLETALSGFKQLRYDQRARLTSYIEMGATIDQALGAVGLSGNWDEFAEEREAFYRHHQMEVIEC